jgi:hypothetical protein
MFLSIDPEINLRTNLSGGGKLRAERYQEKKITCLPGYEQSTTHSFSSVPKI